MILKIKMIFFRFVIVQSRLEINFLFGVLMELLPYVELIIFLVLLMMLARLLGVLN